MGRPKIDRETIVRKALDLIDKNGVESLSMRLLGSACGVEAMSLYNHVRDKGDILDGVVDYLYGGVEIPLSEGDWKRDLAGAGRAWRAVLLRHPRALPLVATRPARGEGGFRFADTVLGYLAQGGIQGVPAIYALNGLAAFVVGHALLDVGTTPGHQEEEGSFVPPSPSYTHLLGIAEVYPLREPDAEFEAGLTAFVAGLAHRA